MKRLILAGLTVLGAFGTFQMSTPQANAQGNTDCALVLCQSCPDGYKLSPTPGNCCRCVRN